jgi:hypothetical protein
MTYRPASQVLARRLPGGTVLVDLESNRIFELNETGARIWDCVSEGLDQTEVLRRLVDEFEVEADRAARELEELLTALAGAGLIRKDGSST